MELAMRDPKLISGTKRGFTLVELLVVIGIIALLISILLPALRKAQETARRVHCASNMKTLTTAYMLYCDDNKQILPDSWPDRQPVNARTQIPWHRGDGYQSVQGWGTQYGNKELAFKDGCLYKYINNVQVFHCAGDFSWHVGSFAINSNLNGEIFGNPKPLTKRSEIRKTSEVFVFIEENDLRYQWLGYNIGAYGVNKTGTNWIDPPGSWHNNGTNVSFMDGHVEYWKWEPYTARMMYDPNASRSSTPALKDYQRLQRACGFR
jgi:prepilin-type N-terminal cleavage/methylation domain-containing protein/prepilin-type processing-associated H-X9-DG protein